MIPNLAQATKEQERLASENILRMDELCDIAQALFQQGVVMELDVNRVRINLQNLEAQHHEFLTLHVQQLNLLRFLMAAATFVQAKGVAQAGGRGAAEAEQYAVISLKGRVAVQATLVAMKEITGYSIWILFAAAGLVLLLPDHKGETM